MESSNLERGNPVTTEPSAPARSTSSAKSAISKNNSGTSPQTPANLLVEQARWQRLTAEISRDIPGDRPALRDEALSRDALYGNQ